MDVVVDGPVLVFLTKAALSESEGVVPNMSSGGASRDAGIADRLVLTGEEDEDEAKGGGNPGDEGKAS